VSFLLFAGKDIRVRSLTPRLVEDWMATCSLESPGSRNRYRAFILAPLNWATSEKAGRLLHQTPLRGRLPAEKERTRGGEAVWPPGVYEKIHAAASPAFRPFLQACGFTGARPSLVSRVEAKHYNVALRVWDVAALYERNATKKTTRVWLTDPTTRALVERLNALWPEGPVFRTSRGNPWSRCEITRSFHAARDKAGLPQSIILYGLRHTFATRFLQAHPGELEYLRVLLGHKDLKMILQTYSHLIDQHAAVHKVLEGFNPLA
jgi:integrase